jgi:predicted DNA-binding protein YlxM (UPF0122 family)
MDLPIWNVVLSLVSGLILMWVKNTVDEQRRIQILLNKTREEIAKEYVTKADVHGDINRVIVRLDKLEEKLDAFMKEQRNAINKP